MSETAIPEDLSNHRDIALQFIREYQNQRIEWYDKVVLKKFLAKDVTMFAARGCVTAFDYLNEAFHATESSSEETVIGTTWQKILASISDDTLDTGDLTTLRGGVLWVLELKSQPNTTNSSSLPQELRSLRSRKEEIEGRRRASGQQVKAALCIAREGKVNAAGKDETVTYRSSTLQRENRDLDGFEYRYISGKKFWQWLAGYDSEVGLLMPISDIDGTNVKLARDRCYVRLSLELTNMLDRNDLGRTIDDLVKLRDRFM